LLPRRATVWRSESVFFSGACAVGAGFAFSGACAVGAGFTVSGACAIGAGFAFSGACAVGAGFTVSGACAVGAGFILSVFWGSVDFSWPVCPSGAFCSDVAAAGASRRSFRPCAEARPIPATSAATDAVINKVFFIEYLHQFC
jgi:hypothetical protein